MKKIYFFRAILAAILLAGTYQAGAQVSTFSYTTVGNTTWTCPTGVTTVTVQCWGGGGGGGGVATASNVASGGGAGGSYTTNTVTVVPGTTYTITVGAGGAGGTTAGTNGSTGGSSSFGGTSVVAVGGPGGQGGTAAGSYTAGLGTTTGNTSGTNFAGGNGASGASTTIGGGGGGGAGNANVGGNAAGSTAGTGGTVGGGNGGAGVSNATGTAGTAPGGGGGGTRRTTTSRAGGAGARGQVILAYTNPAPTVEAFPSQVFCTNTYPTAYNTVNFSLVETAVTNFDASQTNQTLVLTLPAGFEFNTAAGPSIVNNTANGVTQDITIGTFTVTTSSITVNLTTNGANAGLDEINFLNFQIRAITAGASGDLVRSGGTFKVNGSTSVPSGTTSFGHLSTATPSVYNSSSVSQYSTANVIRGCTSTPYPILEFQVNVTGGYCNPNDVITQFVFSTAGNPGCTNATTDITKAEVYYSDTTGGFSNANFFGSVTSPSGTFTITGSQALDLGTGPYYFYLVYTVPATATVGDVLDASMSSFTFNGTVISSMTTPNPAGSRTIVAGTCPSAPDLVPPTVNTQTITAGSLIIPMDNTHQALVTPFNLKAYGLVHALLQADIPVKWIIKSGKAKDAADFSATVTVAYPTSSTVTTTETFTASAFAIDSFYLTHSYYSGGQTATQVMTSFAVTNNVRVYKLTADVAVDVRYTLNHRPKLAVFSNGGYETIQTNMLDAAGITNYYVQNAGDFTGLAECYTFCSESHWDYSANPDTRPVQRVVDFVNEGGNFLAQCAGIDLYENHQPLGGHFQTTQGISYPGATTALGAANLANYNPDMAFAQYQGNVTSQTGRIPYFYPAASSLIKPETFAALARTTSTNTMVATAVHLGDPDSSGYNVFYLAGHDYTGTGVIGDYNGMRIYLNATLIPAGRPTAFPITITSTPTICAGQSVSIGPVCASGATYAWSPTTGLSSATTCNPIASPTVTTAYTVVGFNGGCIMGPTTMTVNVNPTPVMTSTNSATICGNGTVNIPLTSNLTSTYTWIAADNPNTTGESITTQTTSTLNNTIVNTSTVTQTVIYTVTPTSTTGTCTGTPQTVTVTVSPAPTMTSANTATICSAATVNIPLTANLGGATFTWIATDNPNTTGESITSQSTATLSNTITNNTTTAQTVVYTVTPTSGGCLGTAQTVSVTVNPTPSATATPSSQTICSGAATSIALTSGVGGTTYSWTVSQLGTAGASNSSGSSITQTLTATGSTAGTATYTITPASGGCSGTPITVPVTVNPIPSATATPATQSICSGSATSVALTSNVTGTTFAWSVTQTNVSGASNSSGTSITQTLTATGATAGTAVYTITPTAGTCPGIPITTTVTVNPIPTVTASPTSQSICSNSTTTVTLNGNVAGATYSWTVTQTNVSGATVGSGTLIAQTLTATSTSIGTAVYTITPTASSCSGTPVTVTVTVNPAPSATATPSSQSICSGGTTTVTLTSSTGGATFNWTVNQTNVTGATASTGTLIAQTLTATTSNAGTAVYTITPSAGGCAGTPVTTTVTVNPIPTVTASTTSQSICSNNTTTVTLSSSTIGATFNWTVNQTNVTGASAGTGTLIAQTLTATTSSAGTAVYTITPSAGTCAGSPITVTVTVNPAPTATATPNSQSICSGTATSIALSSSTGGATFAWTVTQTNVSGASNSSGTSIAQTLNATTASNGTAVYTITPSAGGCAGTPITATVTVKPIPTITATPTSQSLCSGATTTVSLSSTTGGTTYSWTVSQTNVSGATASTGTLIAETLTATANMAGTAVYTVTPTASSCSGSPVTVTVTVNPIPSATATPNSQSFCSGGATSIALSSNVTGTTYSWTVTQSGVSGAANGSGSSIGQTLNTTGAAAGTATYTITPSASACGGTPITATVTVNPAPVMTSAGTATICSGGTVNIPLTANVGSNFSWIATDNPNTTGESTTTQSTSTLNNTITNSTTSAQNVVYTVTPTSTAGSCAGTPQTVTVTVNPVPAMTSASTATICSGGAVSITLTSNVASTYTWIAANNANTTGESITTQTTTVLSNTITNSTTSVQNVIYTVTPTSSAGSCAGTSQTVTVTVNPTPAMTSASTATICSGASVNIPLTANVGSTFTWIAANNPNTTGESTTTQNTSTINDAITNSTAAVQTVVYTVTPTSTGGSCAGVAQTVSVTVNPTPSMTSVNSATICSGGTVNIPLTANVGSSFTWIATDNPNTTGESTTPQTTNTLSNTITSTTGNTEVVVYTVTPTSTGGSCAGVAQTVSVTVSPTPVATATPNSQTLCSGNATSIALSSNVTGTSFNWTVSQTNASGASAGSGTSITQTITATAVTAGTVIYTITPVVGSCSGTATTATVTVNPAPVMTVTPASQSICSGNATSIALSSNVAGTTYSWTVSQTGASGAASGSGSSITQTLTATSTSQGTAVYTITPTAGTCSGASSVVTVSVNPIPSMTSASTATICSGGAVSITLTSNVASTYTWIAANNANTTGESITTQTTSVLSNTITNSTTSVQNVIYTVTPTSTGGSCAGASQTVTVTVNPTPAMTSASTATICSGASVNIPLTANVGSTFTWISANNPNTTGESTTTQNTSTINDAITNSTAAVQTVVYTVTPTSTGGSCAGTPQTVSVTVNPTPSMTSVNSATICSGGTVSIPLTSNVASTYSWIAANNPNTTGESTTTQTTNTLSNTITSTTGNTEVVIYTVTPTSSGGSCVGVAQTVSVTVSPTPVATATPNSQTLCSGSATSIALSSNVTGTTFNWTVSQTNASGASAGSGTSITQTITATAVTAGTVIYTITPVVGSCTGITTTATVTVNPAPVMTVTPSSQSICSGNATSITLNSNVGGTAYSWTVSQTGVSGAANGSGSSITQTLTATSTTQGTAVYTITPTAGTCSGASSVVTVSVNPVPSVTATPSSQAFCSGGATSIALSSNVTGTTYSWTVSQSGVSGASNGSGSAITQTLATTGASPGTATYTITPTAGTCNGTPIVVTVTVNPIPAAPTASSNSPVCLTNTINLSAGTVSGATYTWNGPNGFSSNTQNPSISNASLAEAGTYSVNVTVNGCTGPTQTVSVVVNTPPPGTLSPTSNSPVCTGQTLNLNIGAITSGSYSWSGPNTFTSFTQNPSIGGVTSAAAGTYTVNVTVPGCAASGTGTVSVVVNPTPSAPVAGNNGPLCAGDNLNLTASNTGTTYNWSGPASYTSTTQNPTITNVSAANAGVYTVTATALGCTSAAGTTTVVINPIPTTPSASSNSPLCVGQTINLSTSTVAGATYSWSGPGSYASSTQNPSITNANASNAGTYSVTITVNGCTSAAGTVAVNVNSSPATPTAGSNSPVCTGDTLFLTASAIGGATYSWTGPNSFSSTSQNPFITPVTAAAAGTYTVIANNGCASTPATVSVVVNVKPSPPTPGNNSPVCQGSTLNLTASTVGGASYNWTGPNGFSSSVQNPSVTNVSGADAGTYSVTVTLNGCTSTFTTTAVTVNVPAVASAGGSQTVCANNPSVVLTGTVSGGSSTGVWSTAGSGSFAPATTALNATYTPSNADTAAGSVVLTLTSSNNGACAASVSSLTVTITDAPVANAGPDQAVCANNASVVLGGSVSGGATGGSWTTSGSGTFSPNANTLNATYTPSVADTTAGIVTFTLTTTGVGQCIATTDQMTLTITSAPTVNAGPDQIKCKSSINTSLNGTVTVTNSGTWTTLGSGTFTPNANTLNATYVPSTADTAAGSVLLVLTSSNINGCTPASDTMRITFTDIPVVNAGSSQVVCGNNAVVALNGSVTVGSTTGTWSTTGTGTFTPNNTTLNGSYIPSGADTAAGSVILTLTSTGGCVIVKDSLTVTITNAPVAYAGADISVCSNNPNAAISGTVSGATNTGIWSSTGSGTFNPSNTSLSGTYVPSGSDISGGSVFLILTSTNNNNCNAAVDSLKLTFTAPPSAFAGNDTSFCANSTLTLGGVITGGGGTGSWTTSGSGTFSPNATALNATYVPSAADTAAGSVTLTLTSTNNGGCLAATDQVVLTITDGPTINAGANQIVCSNNNVVTLNGQVTVSTGVQWSTPGDGTFGSATSSSTTYTPGTTDISNGSVTIIATSTGNGGCNAVKDTMLVQIDQAPVVNAGSNQFICSGVGTVSLSGSVTGVTTTGTWTTLGSGSFTSPNSLSTTYSLSPADTLAGSVTLILTSTNNGSSCNPSSDTVVVAITPAGYASAGNDTTVCSNVASVNLSGVITGGTGAGQWSTSGTGTFTPNNTTLNASYTPSASDISAGSVVIKLSPINSCMPTADSLVLTLAPAPVVNAGSNLFVCATTNTVALNGSVTGGATTGTWSTLGTGSFSPNANTLNAVYTLSQADSAAGSVNLVLTSTGSGVCNSVSDTVKITLTTTAIAAAGNDTTICSSAGSIALSGAISGGTGVGIWTSSGTGTFTPNDSTLNASYVPSTADDSLGTILLTLTPYNACQPTADSLILTITPAPVVNAGTDVFICTTTNTVTLNGSVTGGTTTGTWTTLGSGTFTPNANTLNAVYTLSAADSTAGSVLLVLTSTNNGICGAMSDTVKVSTTTSTSALAGADTSICANDSLALSGVINGGSTGQWTSTGTGTFSPSGTALNAYYVPSAADVTSGSVVLTLTPTSGCQPAADSLVLSFNAVPVVSAGTSSVICASTNTVALNGSVSGGSTTGNWTTSGSGTFSPSSTTLNGTYTLSQADSLAGSVTLVLTSTNNGSCGASKDSITVTITTPASATAGSNVTVCGNNSLVSLNGTITGGSGQGQWTSSGSGVFAPADTVLNATYSPSGADVANGTVVLTLTPINSCAPTADSIVITITPAPTVNAGNDTSICGGSIALNGSINTVPTGAVWTSNGAGAFTPNDSTLNATYVPAVGDNDTLVFVLTTSGNGQCNAATDTVRVIRGVQPNANFVFGGLCQGQSVAFTDSTVGGVLNWSWNFGNGDTSTAQNPAYTYTASGTYTVSLHVSAGTGCDDSISKVVHINASPLASFTLTNACFNDSVHFTNTSSIGQGAITSWNWGFGDGNTSTAQNPSHLYDSVKVYIATLAVTSDSGCTSTASDSVFIKAGPLAGFITKSNCGSMKVDFVDTSFVTSPDSVTGWNWTFGNGSTSAQQNPSNTYTTTGTYTVLLQVQTSSGCTDTASAVINLGQNVVADYIPAGGTYNTGQNIVFTNQSTGASGYNWSFGNGDTSTVTDPSHAYTQPGTYTVVLVSSNSLGCVDTVAYVFEINTHGVTVPTGFTPNGDGLNDYFYVMGGPFSSYELRVFNEWGNQIFLSNAQSDKWDGTIGGTKQPAGTYVYIFNGKTIDGQTIKLQKEINLIR